MWRRNDLKFLDPWKKQCIRTKTIIFYLMLLISIYYKNVFRKVQTESSTGSSNSYRVRTTLTICVEGIDFDTQACVLRLKGRNIEENKYVKVSWTLRGCQRRVSCCIKEASIKAIEKSGLWHSLKDSTVESSSPLNWWFWSSNHHQQLRS